MLDQPVFGRRLRQLRTERGLTLAALAGEGMSTGYLSRLESGARQPTERAIAHLAAQLGISQVIWRQHIWTVQMAGSGWRSMDDRGSPTANHMDHVHVTTYGDRGTL